MADFVILLVGAIVVITVFVFGRLVLTVVRSMAEKVDRLAESDLARRRSAALAKSRNRVRE